jgi:hypothetical protein
MTEKIISIETKDTALQKAVQRIIRMVPEKDKTDSKLQRLLAFRIKIDGEAATSEFLIRKIREIIQCGFTGSFYEFVKNDALKKNCELR